MRVGRSDTVDDEVVDVVGGGEDATTEEITSGTATARRGNAIVTLHAQVSTLRGRTSRESSESRSSPDHIEDA